MKLLDDVILQQSSYIKVLLFLRFPHLEGILTFYFRPRNHRGMQIATILGQLARIKLIGMLV
jgi:hypothetical protein